MTEVRKLYILLCGYEILPKTVSTRDRGARFVLAEPICAYLLETSQGWVLFDTGLDSRNLRDPGESQELFVSDMMPAPPLILPEHEIVAQMSAIGVAPSDIGHVVLSHVHADHTGNLHLFRHARVSIQRLEHEFAFSEAQRGNRFFREIAAPDIDWHIVEGDWRPMPGIELILTRGHRPGHQSMTVTLPSGATKIITADAGDLPREFRRGNPAGRQCRRCGRTRQHSSRQTHRQRDRR